jgi:glycopeptide antibiotics resistance protein
VNRVAGAWKNKGAFLYAKLALAAALFLAGAGGTIFALRVFYAHGSFVTPFTLALIALSVPFPVALATWLLYSASGSNRFRKGLITAVWWFFVGLYGVILCFVLFGGGRRDYDYSYLRANLTPFSSILKDIKSAFGTRFDVRPLVGLFGNLGLFLPLGFLLPWKMRGAHPGWSSAMLLLAAVVTAELLQQFFTVGVFDVDDILLNFLGVLLGLAVQGVAKGAVKKKKASAPEQFGCRSL